MSETRHDRAMAERDKELAEMTVSAARLLVGKTIVGVEARPHSPACDSANELRVTFSDGTAVDFTGTYGGYTGESCDEYVEVLYVSAAFEGER